MKDRRIIVPGWMQKKKIKSSAAPTKSSKSYEIGDVTMNSHTKKKKTFQKIV